MNAQESAQQILADQGWMLLDEAIDPNFAEILGNYLLLIEGEPVPDDGIVKDTWGTYADPIAESVLHWMTPKVSWLFGIEMIPTFTYTRIYRPGAYMQNHTDRAECEYSASLCVGKFVPEGNDFPLNIDGHMVGIDVGQMAFLKGLEVPHGRIKWEVEGDTDPYYTANIFLHWVDANGPYHEFAYDNRPGLGYGVDHVDRAVKDEVRARVSGS